MLCQGRIALDENHWDMAASTENSHALGHGQHLSLFLF
jgi:hypothetical protein